MVTRWALLPCSLLAFLTLGASGLPSLQERGAERASSLGEVEANDAAPSAGLLVFVETDEQERESWVDLGAPTGAPRVGDRCQTPLPQPVGPGSAGASPRLIPYRTPRSSQGPPAPGA